MLLDDLLIAFLHPPVVRITGELKLLNRRLLLIL